MANYYMSPTNPCPACGQSHSFDGTPEVDLEAGTVFEVTCPATLSVVVVSIPAVNKPAPEPPKDTGLQCKTCLRSTYGVVSFRYQGPLVIETLRCQNPGCENEMIRHRP